MDNDKTTRRVTTAKLKENFALRDEIKQLRLLLAAIVSRAGGKIVVHKNWFERISSRDTVTQRDDIENDCVILTFEGKP